MKLISGSREQTFETGRRIGTVLEKGDIVALTGELGSGKTCLTQGIAKGLGVDDRVPVVSPTFTLINEYPGRVPLFHFDAYRLSGFRDLEDMGYEEYFFADAVIVIEWAEKVRELLPEKALVVRFAYLDENTREMTLEGPADKMRKLQELLS